MVTVTRGVAGRARPPRSHPGPTGSHRPEATCPLQAAARWACCNRSRSVRRGQGRLSDWLHVRSQVTTEAGLGSISSSPQNLYLLPDHTAKAGSILGEGTCDHPQSKKEYLGESRPATTAGKSEPHRGNQRHRNKKTPYNLKQESDPQAKDRYRFAAS